MDFYIPGVPLEQIRYAGLRLQRGGVGFYPTSGSPFVHLDTGSIRHWPRITHDQLARVFPDGRTVHVPSDGTPSKGYELARADIERRGNGDGSSSGGNKIGGFLTALFTGKSAAGSDEDDEGAAPAAAEKPAPVLASANSADRSRPTPCRCRAQNRNSPRPSSSPRPTPRSSRRQRRSRLRRRQPRSPSRNPRRLLTSSMPAASGATHLPAAKQATAAQIAALKAREAVGAADPQATASVSE